jgi:hypothetical protein
VRVLYDSRQDRSTRFHPLPHTTLPPTLPSAGLRGGKSVQLKSIVDEAVAKAAALGTVIESVLVTHRAGDGAHAGVSGWVPSRDKSLDAAVEAVKAETIGRGLPVAFPATVMDAEDPLFILYTSGWVRGAQARGSLFSEEMAGCQVEGGARPASTL